MSLATIARVAEAVNEWMDRRGWLPLQLAFAAVLLLIFSARASVTPFWHDEVYTVLTSALPLQTLWMGLLDGLDLMPPLNTLLTGLVHRLIEPGEIVSRLPSMAAVTGAALLAYLLVRRRANAAAAWSAALLLCCTMAFRYAYEARGYGLTIGCFAVALYAWAESAAGRARLRNLALLPLAIAAGIWAHYYAVLALAPILAGEAVRWARSRQPDIGMLSALGISAVLVVPLVPLIASNAPRTSTFWTTVRPPDVGDVYSFVLGALAGRAFLVVAAIVAVIIVVGAVRERGVTAEARHIPGHELAAGLVCLAIPAAGFLLGMSIGRGVFVERYVLFATSGIAVVVPLAVWRLGPRSGLAEAALLTMLTVMFGRIGWETLQVRRSGLRTPLEDRPMLARVLNQEAKVLVTGGIDYLPLWYYGSAAQRRTMAYLAHPGAELDRTGSNTVDENYLALSRQTDIGVVNADAFLAAHRRFRLYLRAPEWILPSLRERGARLQEDAWEGDAVLYRVELER
jgi:hypothetical protein